MKLECRRISRVCLLSLLFLSAYGYAEGKIITAKQAIGCDKAAPLSSDNACPYPFDVERADATFRTTLSKAMRKAGLGKLWDNGGALRGPQTPLEPVTVSGVTWLRASSCEQHNCGDHHIVYLYQPEKAAFVALYNKGDKQLVIGKPDAAQLSALQSQ
ncbi:Ivy family c-type lysozyme inhibitor [Dickeya lacustris]|uniref:Ivy family c-type lysozyme inhibitor n=1 Tax=Dickeya lacustris TaxID=2259638 RepID=A0ABY8G5D3_9GAMM|nr:Ivy family c-type lysozyme inhibitor [Dickeya lacustris]WFN55158.1 Ivy family c-type lysozyme inhibitor [Dickeya lacustris]